MLVGCRVKVDDFVLETNPDRTNYTHVDIGSASNSMVVTLNLTNVEVQTTNLVWLSHSNGVSTIHFVNP